MTWTICPFFYDLRDPAAEHARKRDDAFFAKHPKQAWRVRPLYEGESPIAEAMRATGQRAYVIVIDHARNNDRRASAGRAAYPVVTRAYEREEARQILGDVARRWAKWFKTHSTTPPPPKGQAIIVKGGRT
jgi:hypothetical protein